MAAITKMGNQVLHVGELSATVATAHVQTVHVRGKQTNKVSSIVLGYEL